MTTFKVHLIKGRPVVLKTTVTILVEGLSVKEILRVVREETKGEGPWLM